MSNKIIRAVMERSGGYCEICGSSYMTQRHHIVGGSGKRMQHETVESVMVLCWNHHHGTYGVHGKNGKQLTLRLRIGLQEKYYSQGYSKNEVKEMMGGRLYHEERGPHDGNRNMERH